MKIVHWFNGVIQPIHKPTKLNRSTCVMLPWYHAHAHVRVLGAPAPLPSIQAPAPIPSAPLLPPMPLDPDPPAHSGTPAGTATTSLFPRVGSETGKPRATGSMARLAPDAHAAAIDDTVAADVTPALPPWDCTPPSGSPRPELPSSPGMRD